MGYTVENADFGYFGYCEIKGFWIKSWFLDKSVLFWGWVSRVYEWKAWFWERSGLNIGSLGLGHLGWDMLSRVWVRFWDGPGQGGGPWVGVVKGWGRRS